ncbi:hypothetical protein C8T65DRAFT_644617 [Cerioporus squamosus]|nr:hypothetical protein C8T65DRAFT_644617 [Cerioporus squamosus]
MAGNPLWAAHELSFAKQIHKQRVAHLCAYCGKAGDDNLRACSLCKSARYCDKKCQLADYKARRKQECAAFLYSPLTRFFMTEPIDKEQFSRRPVFAHAHDQDVGCWVSVDGQVTCNAATSRCWCWRRTGARTARRYGCTARGRSSETFAAVGVVDDPWENRPRLRFLNINGTEVRIRICACLSYPVLTLRFILAGERRSRLLCRTPRGASSHSRLGTMSSYSFQFRVGDGDKITKDFQALGCLAGLSLPWSPSGLGESESSDPLVLDRSLAESMYRNGQEPGGLVAPFHHPTIRGYYEDYIVKGEKGEKAYVESRFGRERAEMVASSF